MTTLKELGRQIYNRSVAIHTAAAATVAEARAYSEEVDRYINRALEPFGLKVHQSLLAGSASKDWKMEVSVHPDPYYWRSPTEHMHTHFLYLGNGKFVWNKFSYELNEATILKGMADPYDGAALLACCERLTEELGFPVTVYTSTVTFVIGDTPRNVTELLVVYPGGEILCSGEILYMNWECSDKWAIVREANNGKLHLYYGNDGHGGEMNVHVPQGGSYEEFQALAEEANSTVTDWDTAYDILRKNW